ncbi:MAG: GspE/PulE family protein [Armatimonadota bacterium]
METVIEGRWKGRGGARLFVAPEGLTLVDHAGAVVGAVAYPEVAGVSAGRRGRGSLLRLELQSREQWVLEGLHPLQARFASELVQEQLVALQRRQMPLYAQALPLPQLVEAARSILSGSQRGVIELLDFLLAQAAHHGASDLHLEPFPASVRVRFRRDGVLLDVLEIPALWLPRLLARLKILAGLAIYRSDVPQEGRMPLRLPDRTVDLRVTLLPTLHGEKAVLRLFDPARALLRLDQLGMAPELQERWQQLLQQPQGMLLLTGPSNHGKTTTQYASLSFLHEHRRDLSNLCTVEDPVEYDLRVVNQTQVNDAVGLTFAAGLRTVLRQDPEVIMIGEIRDEETAGIAIRAGLTGHLILSTVHARSSPGVFPRLLDLGCEPHLVAGAVSAVLAQRLVRTICGECRAPAEATARQQERLGLGAEPREWSRGAGCGACGGTGYRGRTGLFDLLEVDEKMRDAVLRGRSVDELEALAGGDGLRADGVAKAAAGITSLDELERVLGSRPWR